MSSQNRRPLPRQGMWVILRGLAEVLGDEGFKRVLSRAGLPPVYAELGRQGRDWPESTHVMAGQVTRAVFDLYPPNANELLLMAGRAQFRHARENLPLHLNMLASMLRALPRDVRMKVALEQGARDLRRSSNALPEVIHDASAFYVNDAASPACAGQTASFPMCVTRLGLLSAAMEWATEGLVIPVKETACHAMGAELCVFVIPKRF